MKKSLLLKFIFGYIIFAVIGFILIATFSHTIVFNKYRDYTASKMQKQAEIIASEYLKVYQGIPSDSSSLDSFTLTSELTDKTIWITDSNGLIFYDSASVNVNNVAEAFNPVTGNKITEGTMGGMLSENSFSVFTTINGYFKTVGYVIIHEPVSITESRANIVLISIYETFGIIFAVSFILMIILYFSVILPLRKITAAADEYAGGNLRYELKINSSDEVGYLANTLNSMASDLSEAENNQRQFISNVSHDFRSPLTSIKGYLEAIRDGIIPPEEQGHYIDLVINETDRLTALTQNVLNMNNLKAGVPTLDYSKFNINAIIKATCESFEGQCLKKNMDFDLYFYEEESFVRADCEKIKQVLYNLIDNAIKFSPSDSTITISTDKRGGKIFVSVKDQGCGISKENIKKIWNRFFKTDESRGKDKKGTGLGLAIVKEIILAHGEKIDVVSTPGSGSEFTFTLKSV